MEFFYNMHHQIFIPIVNFFTYSILVSTTANAKKLNWAHSVEGLEYLSTQEELLYPIFKQEKKVLEIQLRNVKNWINEYERDHLDLFDTVDHPLKAFKMIRRFGKLMPNILQTVQLNTARTDLHSISAEFDGKYDNWPNYEDYANAMENIIKLRHVYELNAADLINGKIAGIQTKSGLTQSQVHEIGIYAEQMMNAFSEAIIWLESAATIEIGNNETIDVEIIRNDIARISQKHDKLHENLTDNNYWDNIYRFSTPILNSGGQMERLTLKQFMNQLFPLENPSMDFQFENICSGRNSMTTEQKPMLYCFYEMNPKHPVWLLSPLKIEIFSFDPYVIRIYDVITESINTYLKQSAIPAMEASRVLNFSYNSSDPNAELYYSNKNFRSSSMTFFKSNTKELDRLELRIGRILGLEVNNREPKLDERISSEAIQVASYSFNGHFSYHYDNVNEEFTLETDVCSPLNGDKIATFMLYLTDVRMGGHTCFPLLGVSVPPVRNSAVFWFNLLKNGNRDQRMLHGGCPVLIGKKWVSNIWVLSFANFQNRKCSLNPVE